MKNLRNILVIAFATALIALIHSCESNADDFLKFTEGGAISYTGKIDSLKILPGRDRIKINGLIISDPKVSQLRIYWNAKRDSVVIPINRTSGVDVISSVVENLPENIYNFEVKTFDAKGNGSISQYITAQTYGTRYQASLNDRKIITSSLSSDLSLKIDFASMDLITGAYATEIVYTDKFDVEKTVTVPVTQSQVVIPNYKIGSKFKQRSLFLPVPTSIDIFSTAFVMKEPQVIDLSYLILNNSRPFAISSSDGGRWGILANWTTNAACKNHGGYGGWDGGCCGNLPQTMNLESGWGGADIINGKIYQTLTLDPGTYVFKANLYPAKDGSSGSEGNYGDADFVYITATSGATLSNTDAGVLPTNPLTLGYKKLVSSLPPDNAEFTFTLTSSQQVSLGLATTQRGEKFGHILGIKLLKKNN